MTLAAGTRIELFGTPAIGMFPAVPVEHATICRPRKSELPLRDGCHIVQFASGGKLCVHESRFRVIDNR